ncbi:MAG: hypothetical protein QHJ73_14600, partial [Armatimonadota bacterium]|nr:hypothetical protein [Armatimonadota bacterium]
YPDRWVYASKNLANDAQVAELEAIVNTAADHGLNGLLLSSRWETLDLAPPDFFPRLERVKAVCQRRGVELIPILFSAGYGGGVLAHDRNLAEGLPVVDAPFVVRGSEARLAADPEVRVVNGGFEEWENGVLKGYRFNDRPGDITVPDTQVVKEGKTSIRFQNFNQEERERIHARVMQEVAVRPRRHYRVSAWVRTQNLVPASGFRFQVYSEKGVLAPVDLDLPATTDWRLVQMTFNSKEFNKIRFYAGIWGGRSGMAWMDDLRIEEVGLVNVLRRPGTPLKVRSADTGTVYEEEKDFARVEDPELLRAHTNPAGPAIRLLPGSRIRDGERLLVSFYHALPINRGQVTVCMSEPKTYDIWRQAARLVQQHVAPKKWFLSMDEIRAGGSCEACKARNLDMGRILGDCITRQVEMIRAVSPGAEVYCWSDMLDPNHNAHGDYYLVEGDFTGSWNHVPKDLIICCWYFNIRDKSLRFFSERGFRTLAGAYYDGDDLENCRGWLEAMRGIPNCRGIMYTTWQNKYALLGAFGDLLR